MVSRKVRISSIRLNFEDGSCMEISDYDLKKIEAMGQAMDLLDRAKRIYEQLKPMFADASNIIDR